MEPHKTISSKNTLVWYFNQKKFSNSDFKIGKLSPFVHSKNLIEIIDLIEDSHYSISRNVNSKIVFTSFAIKMTKLINTPED